MSTLFLDTADMTLTYRFQDKGFTGAEANYWIKSIFAKPNDRIAKEQRKDTIYSIPWSDCDQE